MNNQIIALERYFVFLLCGMLLFPAVLLADDKDSSGLAQSVVYKTHTTSSTVVGLANYKKRVATYKAKVVSSVAAFAQKPKKNWFKGMRYSGWTRFYPFYRHMDAYYDIAPTEGLTIPVNITANDGYQQPLMLLRLEANPSAKTWFQTELQFDHQLLRKQTTISDTSGRRQSLFVIFQLQGAVDTRFGKIKMIAGGGVNWYRLSPSTLWSYQYRDDLFERYPWDPEGHDFNNRYNSYYFSGDIPRDQRFGMQATQGFILEGTNLPAGFDAAILYGKTASGAFQSYLNGDPLNMFAGRIGKKIVDHKIGFNYFSQYGYNGNQVVYKAIAQIPDSIGLDSFYVEDNRISQIVTSIDGRFEHDRFSIFTELGVGSYFSNTYNVGLRKDAKPGVGNVSRYQRDWDETLFLEISTKKNLTRIPLKFAFYRIGPLVVSNNSTVMNTSVEQAKPSPATPNEYYTNYYDGAITDVGQLANNRQGMNFFLNKDKKKLKVKFDMGISQEIVNQAGDLRNGGRSAAVAVDGVNADSNTTVPFTNSITFEHKLNGLTRSRFAFYKRFTGPYQRFHSIFRRQFENIAITDSVIDYRKSFNTIDLELKYKFRLFGKEIIVSNFNNYSSVQDRWSAIPLFNSDAFLRYFYEEFLTFYAIHPKITLVGFAGYERVLGNHRVEVADENGDRIVDAKGRPVAQEGGKTINQTGHGYGLGLDYNFHNRASIHLRHRWFDHKDKNFALDRFKGNEMTVEFKAFF